jgi:hypothetical protein
MTVRIRKKEYPICTLLMPTACNENTVSLGQFDGGLVCETAQE